MMLEGILSIQAGDNPRVVEEKLRTFLDDYWTTGLERLRDVAEAAQRDKGAKNG